MPLDDMSRRSTKMKSESKKSKTTARSLFTTWGCLLILAFLTSTTTGQYYAYVPNMGVHWDSVGDDVSIIDLATNAVVATVPVGSYPQGIAINPAGTAAYVANSADNSFTVIDIPTFTSTTIQGLGGYAATGVAVHPDGTRIYVSNPEFFSGGTNSKVWVVDRATHSIIDEISCGRGTFGIAVHPDGKVAYVTNANDDTIAVFDTETHEVLDTIALETVGADESCFPVPIVVHPEGTFVYAANRDGPTFWAINTATHEVLAFPFGHEHVCMGIHPDGTAVYLSDFDGGKGTTVDVIDTKTLNLVTTIDGMNGPLGVAVHPDGTRLYVANSESDTVSVVDAITYAHITDIAVGAKPEAYGQFVGPGVPRLLKSDAVARLESVKERIAGDAEGVVSPQRALEHLESALNSGNACLQENLWSASDTEKVDPRRLQAPQGTAAYEAAQNMVQATLDAIRRGWIINPDLRSELLAVVDEILRADRVLAAVAIDDAVVGGKNKETIEQAQTLLETGNALVKQARLWDQMDRKAVLLADAISAYQQAWQTALN